jgi:hypothetical protein
LTDALAVSDGERYAVRRAAANSCLLENRRALRELLIPSINDAVNNVRRLKAFGLIESLKEQQ